MVRDACSDAGSRVAGDARERLVTDLMFPLSSLEQPRVPAHFRPRKVENKVAPERLTGPESAASDRPVAAVRRTPAIRPEEARALLGSGS